MSNSKVNNGINIFVKILTAIIVILLVLGIVGGVVYLLNRPQGLYIEYNGTVYGNTAIGSSTGGISVPYDSTVTFTICNSDGWGVYSVQDCIVRIIPNTDDSHDFRFTIGDDYISFLYSKETDVTAAFCEDYDGNSITVSDDGTFTVVTDKIDVADVLTAVYPEGVMTDGEYLLTDYPYIALSVTSPDGSETLTVPLLFHEPTNIELDKDSIIFW